MNVKFHSEFAVSDRVGIASPFAKASDFAKASSDKSEDKSEATLHGFHTDERELIPTARTSGGSSLPCP